MSSSPPLDLWAAVWGQNSLAGRLIVLAIGLLAVPTMLTALRHLKRYGSELSALRRVAANLAHWRVSEEGAGSDGGIEKASEEDADAVPPEPVDRPVDVDALLVGVRPRSLVAERLEALRKLRAHRVKINLDTLRQLTWTRDAAEPGTGLPGFAGGTALLLGILGTFVGLAAMVQQIDLGLPDAGAAGLDSWASSITNLRQVLGGMRTAFSTSLVGMGTAVCCFGLDFWIGRRRSRFHERLERLTVEDLLPALVPTLEDENLLERVSLQLEGSFARLDEIFDANREIVRNLTGAEHAFAAIVDEIRRVTNSDARQDLRQVIANMEKTSQSFLELSSQLPRIVTAVERGSGRVSRHLEAFRRRWFPAAIFILVLSVWLALAVAR